MFQTLKLRLLLGLYVFLLLSIPVGAYLASQNQNPNASAQKISDRTTITTFEPSPQSKVQSLLNDLTPSPSPITETIPDSFGPIMDFILYLEGRPVNKQSAKVFVGIAEGAIVDKPNYLLQFTIDLPDDGKYPNLSLAGLTSGNTYSAYLKGPGQIATSSAFIMSTFTTHLNNGQPLKGLSGDLNDDNTINDADLSLMKSILGTTSASTSFNSSADFNKDGVINSLDLSLVTKNMDKTGDSGVWQSQPGGGTMQSAPTGGGAQGYWLWVPDI